MKDKKKNRYHERPHEEGSAELSDEEFLEEGLAPEDGELPPVDDDAGWQAKEKEYSEKIEALNGEVAKYKDMALRGMADLENYKRRAAVEREKLEKFAVTGFAKDVLSVADALERALKSLPPEENRSDQLKSFIKGAEITLNELLGVLAKNNIKPIESIGKVFNPNYHKVVQQKEDDTLPEGTIIEEWQTGYMIADRVLREAMVIVSKKSAQASQTHVDTNA